MYNCIDYLRWRGDLSFETDPLNEIDLACLNMLIVLDFNGIIPESDEAVRLEDVCRNYFARDVKAGSELGALEPAESVPLAEALIDSPRFAEVLLSGYRKKYCEESTEQFGAVTCDLPTGERVIVYKSTDDTFIGWKEDFMMAVSDHLPSQADGLQYLTDHAGSSSRLILTGHSKGGNLAAYAAIHAPAELQDRILRVISFDGPGFSRSIVKQDACKRVAERILTIVPQSSVVGMLLHTPGKRIAVLAEGNGVSAHAPFLWAVERASFLPVSRLSPFSQKFDKSFDAALEKLSREDRIRFIDELFEVLSAGGAETVTGLKTGDFGKVLTAAAQTKEHRMINSFLKLFLDEYMTTDGMRKIRRRHEEAAEASKQAVAERRKSLSARKQAMKKDTE